MKRYLSIIIILLISCSTPYQPKGALGGYSSKEIGENTYKVEFKGNQHIKAETVFENLERRCAEITLENEFDYFVIYEDSSYIDNTVFNNEPGIDDYLEYTEFRADKHSLTEKTGMDYDPLQTLMDTKTRVKRTYVSTVSGDGSSYANTLIDLEATEVVGVFKIMLVNDIIENFKDFYHPASEILGKYRE